MSPFSSLAVIGVGPSAIYLLQQLEREIERFIPTLTDIYLFEESAKLGVGMPYDRCTTDEYNLCNISSAEIPPLHQSLVDWLRTLDDHQLAQQGIQRSEIDADETYRRTMLGDYFHSQYAAIASALRVRGITLHEFANCRITDVRDDGDSASVEIRFGSEKRVRVDRVVISTGHSFPASDEPENGYYASPWPMQKIIPAKGQYFNYDVGILGASLSAFDVVSSLAHRHGTFERSGKELRYLPAPGAEKFRIVLHSAEGCLPHLQYEQDEPFRIVYRHVDRETMLTLRDERGMLSLDDYFDMVCRPALVAAFEKDQRPDIVTLLSARHASLEMFVETMSKEHTSDDPFALMRLEMGDARRSLRKGLPIHWKETLDDLMFTLNFHFDWLPAEDHLRYRKVIMPFLMNVIAAMPLHSASVMLALHDAGHLEMLPGLVTVTGKRDGFTHVEREYCDKKSSLSYRMFVNCGGQGGLEIDAFPFAGLRDGGIVTEATVPFSDNTEREKLSESARDKLTEDGRLRAGGIAIDGYYRVIGQNGESSERIYDIAFPHATGVRPYSYGLQACDATAAVVVQSWCAECEDGRQPSSRPSKVTATYEEMTKPVE